MATLLRLKNLFIQRLHLFSNALLLVIFLGIAGQSQAQVYYLMSGGNNGTTAGALESNAGDAFYRVGYDGTNEATIGTSIAHSPYRVELDGNSNRVFILDALYSQNNIKVRNLATGAFIRTLEVAPNPPQPVPAPAVPVPLINNLRDMVYDPRTDYLYFITEGGDGAKHSVNDKVARIKADGTGTVEEVATADNLLNPYGLELDMKNNRLIIFQSNFAARKLFFVDLASKAITSRAFATNYGTVWSIAYDEVEDCLYYTVSDGGGGVTDAKDMIRRQKGDGTGDLLVVDKVTDNPVRLRLDMGNNRVFVNNGNYANMSLVSVTLPNTISKIKTIYAGTFETSNNYPSLKDFNLPRRAKITTAAATSVSSASVTLGGNLVFGYGLSTERGVVYSTTNAVPTTADAKASMATNTGNGAYSATVSGLTPSTSYYARAYAANSAGTMYGDVVTFSTTSNNANLSSLGLSSGTLTPAFAAGTTNYTANVAYDKASINVTPTVQQTNATVKVNGTVVTSGAASGALSLVTGTNTITTLVTAQDGIATQTYTITITKDKNPQTITFNTLSAKTYGDGDFNLGASASSTLPVTYTSGNPNVATVSSAGLVHIVGAGTANITAAQAGNSFFLPATNVSQTLTVNKAMLTYTANNASRDYGAANPAFTGSVSGFVNGDNQASATTGTPVFTSAANATSPVTTDNTTVIGYPVIGSGLNAANYSFVQAAGNNTALTLNKVVATYTVQPATKVYGTVNPSFNVVFTGLVNGETISNITNVTSSSTATKTSPAGSYPVTAGIDAVRNYTFQPAAANAAALTVTKANLTFTAAAATRTYGANNPTLAGTISGFVNSESVADLTGTASYNTSATATSPIGSYPVVLGGVSSDKYTITAAAANSTALTITKGTLTYVADPASRAFNTSPNPPLTGTVTGFANGETQASATTGTPVFATAVTQSTPVGSYAINGSGLTSANYDIIQSPVNATAFSIYLSSNGDLSSLSTNHGTLSPAFSPGTKTYTITVSTGTTSITVTPAVSDANAHVTVNGVQISSGTASASIPLSVGPNTIPVNVTAQDGTTTNPYTILVTRSPSDDATLSSFSIAGIALPSPDAYNNYRINVENTVESYTFTATLNEPNAIMRINGVIIPSGVATTIPLHLGENVNNIFITAQDGTTYGYTGVIITRAYKSNNLLSSLTVNTGTLSPAFDSNTTAYEVEVDNATTTLSMTPEYDETASGVQDGFTAPSGVEFTTQPLNIGDNLIPIVVYAQNGASKTYNVNVKRAVSTDANLADLGIMTTISGLDVPFDASTDTYNTTVSSDVTGFRVKPTATNSGASVTVNGIPLDTYNGNVYNMKYFTAVEPVVIEVTAGDMVTKRTYTINVVRNFSTNNLLSSFGINGYEVTPDFDTAVNDYTINIADPSVTGLNMIPLAQDPLSEVKINSITVPRNNQRYVALNGGANLINVSVLAFGATENVYKLTVNRSYSANADLAALLVNAGGGNAYNNSFDVQSGGPLSLTVPNSVSSLFIQPIADDAGGTVLTVNGYALVNEVVQVPIELGDNAIVIKITSGDNSVTRTYTAHINRLPFVDINLSSLTTTSGVLTPAFSPAVTSYTVVLPSDATTFSYTPVNTQAGVVVTANSTVINASNPTYVHPFSPGPTTNSSIVVTAPDGINTKRYTISFIKPNVNTAVLGNLSLSSGKLSPAFARNTLAYTASVPYSASTIKVYPYSPDGAVVTAVVHKGDTSLVRTGTPYATVLLNLGLDTVTVTTKSPSGTGTRTYTVVITRNAPATDATLASLTVSDANISPVFNAAQDAYTANLNYSINSTVITPTTTDTTATVTVAGINVARGSGSAPIALNEGDNVITTVVTAENGNTKTYTTTVNRQAPASDANLADLLLNEGSLSQPFTAAQLTYTATVANSVTSFTFIPVLTDPNATLTVNGDLPDGLTGQAEMPLAVGVNTINIVALAQDGQTTKTYTLTVTRAGTNPTVDYGAAKVLAANTAITPITPVTNNVAAFGYSSTIGSFGGTIEGGKDVATDSQGNVYIVDIQGLVTKHSPDGTLLATINDYDHAAFAVAVDANDNIYTADGIGSVTKVAAGTGEKTTLATTDNAWYDIAVDKNGTVYVADITDNTVKKIPSGGGTPVVVGTGFDQAASVAVDAAGDVYVGDLGNLKIKKIRMSTDGQIETVLDNTYALSLTFDKANNLYFSESYTQEIRQLPANGGSATVVASNVYNIYGVAVDTKGVVYGVGYFYDTTLSVTPTGGYFLDKTLPTGLNFDQATGIVGGTPTKGSPATTYKVTAYSGTEKGTGDLNIKVTSTNANLINLTLSSGTLSPAFATDTIAYTAAVATASIKVTPTVEDGMAQIRVNGGAYAAVASGNPSANLALNTGVNTIDVQVTAHDGITLKTYTIAVTRGASGNNVKLSFALTPASTLIKVTGTANYNYTASVAPGTDSIRITPQAEDPSSVVRVQGVIVSSGTLSAPIALQPGTTIVRIQVTAPNGFSKTHEIAVSRNGSSNTKVSFALTPAATLIKATGTANYNYTASVAPETETIMIMPKVDDPAAILQVEGAVVASGTASAPIVLLAGTTAVHMQLTTPSGLIRTYQINVSKNGSSNTKLNFTLTPASTLVKSTGPANYNYVTSVAPETESIRIKPNAEDPAAVIKVDGIAVASGSLSAPITLLPVLTTVRIQIITPSGFSKTHEVVVSRNGSSNAKLTFALTPAATTSKATGPADYNYATSVIPETGSIRVTPKADDPAAIVQVEGIVVASGSASAPITLSTGITSVHMQITTPSGLTKTYQIAVSKNGSSNAGLSFTMTPTVSLTSVSGPANYNYTTSVAPGTGSVRITPNADDPAAVVRIQGVVVASGVASAPVTLSGGTTIVNMEIGTPSGLTKTYQIAVTRNGSSNAKLSFVLSPASTLVKVTGPAKYNYTASVAPETQSVRITPKAEDPAAVIHVAGSVVASGTPSAPITLLPGTTTVDMQITTQNGLTRTYQILVSKNGSSNYKLSYSLSTGAVSSINGTADYNFAGTVDASESVVTVKATAADVSSVVRVEGQIVPRGGQSAPISLLTGTNIINMTLTAGDGTVKTYQFALTKPELATMGRNSHSAGGNTDMPATIKTQDVLLADTTVTVHQALSPNGDGLNDVLLIDGLSNYADNNLSIVNASGTLIYHTTAYGTKGNVFDGHSSNGTLQKPGTYYYILEYKDGSATKRKTGYILIKY